MENEIQNTEEETLVADGEQEAAEVEEQGHDEAEQAATETEESKKQRVASQIDRLKKERDEAKAELAKYKGTEQKPASSDDALLARLESRGVMQPEEQEYVLRFAKSEGISPIDALSDEIVRDKLAFFRKQREMRASAISSPNRTGGRVDEVERWVARYRKDGSLPDNNPLLVSQILDRLK